jgi:hypothetical protein
VPPGEWVALSSRIEADAGLADRRPSGPNVSFCLQQTPHIAAQLRALPRTSRDRRVIGDRDLESEVAGGCRLFGTLSRCATSSSPCPQKRESQILSGCGIQNDGGGTLQNPLPNTPAKLPEDLVRGWRAGRPDFTRSTKSGNG